MSKRTQPPTPFLFAALSPFRVAILGIGVTSCIVNLLALTGSFFMLQVYDRVIPGRSLPTLVGLIIIAGTLFAFQGALELIRSMLLARIGLSVDERFGRLVFRSLAAVSTDGQDARQGVQPVRDMETVRNFLSGPGPTALFDLPWMPFYLGLCFLFHVWIGVTATVGAILLIGLAILAEVGSREPARQAAAIGAERMALAEAVRRNAEAVTAMGFGRMIVQRWVEINERYLANHLRASTVTNSLSTLSRIVRLMLQSAVLAVGATLVIRQEATGGIMIASSILASRALAPVELAIGQWKGFIAARQSWSRLADLVGRMAASRPETRLPRPSGTLKVENLYLAAPGSTLAILRNVSFELRAGEALGIIGPSASGKSSLARGMTGLWKPLSGTVRLDQASLAQWDADDLGSHIGYLPQEASLFDGSIADNIARFDPAASSEAIIAAARSAGIYEMIVKLPEGFDTKIGEQGSVLSAGQRQRLALARALYGDPFLVILDEPNANLDSDGDAALLQAILGVRRRGGIVIVIAHRPSALAAVDKVLVLSLGQAKAFGPKEQVLKAATSPASVQQPSPGWSARNQQGAAQ